MKKSFYSAAAAGVLLLAGTGAASALPLVISTPTGVEGFVSITGFADVTPTTYTATFSGLQGAGGGAATINFWDTTLTNGHLKLCGPAGGPPLGGGYVDASPEDPPIIGDPGPDAIYFDLSGCPTVFTGSGTADFPVDSVTFDGVNAPSIANGDTFAFTYDGNLGLFGVLLGNPLLDNVPINGSLTATVSGVSPTGLTLNFTENCVGGTCIYDLLDTIDAGTSQDGIIDATFGFGPDTSLVVPEPASLALLSMGLVGLGAVRRKKAA